MVTPAAAVDEGDWLVRVGAAFIIPDDSSGVVTGVPRSRVDLNSDTGPGITISYMLTEHVGLELVGTSNHYK